MDIAPARGDPYSLVRMGEALRNGAGLRTLFGTFVLAATVMVAMAGQPAVLMAMASLVAFLVLLVGSSAAGMQFMEQARRKPVSWTRQALIDSPMVMLRTLALLALLAAAMAVFILAAVLLLFLCRLPGVGPFAYILVLPLLTLAGAVLTLAALLVLMLAAPALWHGRDLRKALRELWWVVRRRPMETFLHLAVLAALCAVVAGILLPLVAFSFGVTVGLSAMVLSTGALQVAVPPELLTNTDIVGPGAIGSALVVAAVAALLSAILFLGLCLTYLKLAEAPGLAPSRVAAAASPVLPAAPAAAKRSFACPACLQEVTLEDAFCSHCGQSLR